MTLTIKYFLSLALVVTLFSCASYSPIFDNNKKFIDVGAKVANKDFAECKKEAENYLDQYKLKKATNEARRKAVVGGLLGGLGGLVFGNSAQSNANPDSVRAAIDVLAHAASPRVLVLGDMGEVGNDGPQFHDEIGTYAKAQGIDYLFTLGELAQHSSHAFGAHATHHHDIDMLNHAVETMLTPTTTVLVKGSRFMKMERVVQYLLDQPVSGAH